MDSYSEKLSEQDNTNENCGTDYEAPMEVPSSPAEENSASNGSYVTGALGALLGAVIGAVPVALLRYYGHSGYLFGVLIGLLSYFGYKIFNGKMARGKSLIILFCTVIGVLIGVFASDAAYMLIAVRNGQLAPLERGDVFPGIIYLLSNNSEYASDCGLSILLCFIAALIGMSPVLAGGRKKHN